MPGQMLRRRPYMHMNPLCRALNVVVALAGIAVTLPFMLVIAVAIRLSSPGPVLFTQPRVGVDRRRGEVSDEIMSKRKEDLGGRVFTIYKFRTMRPETGTPSQVWATAHDPRITTVGRFLRKNDPHAHGSRRPRPTGRVQPGRALPGVGQPGQDRQALGGRDGQKPLGGQRARRGGGFAGVQLGWQDACVGRLGWTAMRSSGAFR